MKHLYPGHKKLRLHQCGSAPNKRENKVGIGRCPFFFLIRSRITPVLLTLDRKYVNTFTFGDKKKQIKVTSENL